MSGPVIEVWDEGWRLAIVVSTGDKFVTCVTTGSLREVKISIRDQPTRIRPPLFPIQNPRVRRAMTAKVTQFRALTRRFPTKLVRDALGILKQGEGSR